MVAGAAGAATAGVGSYAEGVGTAEGCAAGSRAAGGCAGAGSVVSGRAVGGCAAGGGTASVGSVGIGNASRGGGGGGSGDGSITKPRQAFWASAEVSAARLPLPEDLALPLEAK